MRGIGFVLAYDPEGLFAAIIPRNSDIDDTAWVDSLKVLEPRRAD